MVLWFENGEEILEDEDEDRGELVYGVLVVFEYVLEGMGSEDVNVTVKSSSSTSSSILFRNNFMLSFVVIGVSVKVDVVVYLFVVFIVV